MSTKFLSVAAFVLMAAGAQAGVVKVGSGSYSDAFPGTDAAGRNAYPKAAPQVSGNAASKPVQTNDWWSNELVSNHGNSMFNYPLGIRTQDDGLAIVKNNQKEAIMQGDGPLTVGLSGLSQAKTTVSDFTDWTVTYSWGGQMEATVAQGSPFVYFTRQGSANVTVRSSGTLKAVDGNILVVTGSFNNASYAVYAPWGSTWTVSGNTASSTLGGKSYFSAVLLPEGSDAESTARDWARFAFVYPKDTQANFVYNEKTGKVETTYTVTTDVKEGSGRAFLMGLLPHHWANVVGSPSYVATYKTVRGELKMTAANEFRTSLTFHGVLPTLPAVTEGNGGFSQTELNSLIETVLGDNGLSAWTDSYNDGQLLNRLVQAGRIAKESGQEALFQRVCSLVKDRVESWLTYEQGDIAFMFYYHKPWSAMLGYPAGYGQDSNINDHHFHWGYIIHAAAFLEQYEPGWKDRWGGMVDLLVKDVANTDRSDSTFPYLRNFSPYAGHSWANGTASLGLGNDQESTSESMQFACSLIHWGELSGQKSVRDLGVYLYVTECSAIEEYWFDTKGRNHSSDFTSVTASRIFTNSYDNQNFWGAPIEGSYGIQVYPVHAGSFYLVHDPEYAKKFWNAMCNETEILNSSQNDNIWYDAWTRFYSMTDPAGALQFYNKCNQYGKKFGDSQAHTYQWVHALNQYGTPDQTVTASTPFACMFVKDGVKTYTAQNYGSSPKKVTFSDGFSFTVPAHTLYTSVNGSTQKMRPTAVITANPATCKRGDKVTFTMTVTENDYTVTRVLLSIDGEGANVTKTGDNIYTCVWTATAGGNHTLMLEAETSTGEVFPAGSLTYTVEKSEVSDSEVPAAPAPTHAAANVKSVYSDTYTSEVPGMTVATWSQHSTVTTEITLGGSNKTFKNANFDYVGFDLNGDVDASAMQYLHIDLFPTEYMTLTIYPIADGNDKVKMSLTLKPMQWNQFDIPLSELPGANYGSIDQFKLDGGSGQTFYMDNLYFWKRDGSEPDPDPTAATVTLAANPTTCKAGETVTFTVTVTENDYNVTSVSVKAGGETLSVTASGSAPLRGMEKAGTQPKRYTATWTPSEEGTYTVTATASTSEGKQFSSADLSYTVTKNGGSDPGDETKDEIFNFTSGQGEQGTNLYTDGYQKFSWDGTNVIYTVHFNDESLVPGGELLYGYYWRENGGFQELPMTRNTDGDYSIVLTGYEPGDKLRGHSKVVFKGGGMGVTPLVEYEVPNDDPTGAVDIFSDETSETRYYDLQGRRVTADRLVPGVYIVVKGAKAAKVLVR